MSMQASKQGSGVSEQANGRASGPVLQSVILVVLAHSEAVKTKEGRHNAAGQEPASMFSRGDGLA